MQEFTIVLIEDEQNILDFIQKTLKSNDYKVLTAKTGQAGMNLITSQCPDLIILDLGLPDMDGSLIIPQVRHWSSCPIIVLSARTGDKDKVSALDSGADDYITKPFSTSELLARIRTALRHSNRINMTQSPSTETYSSAGLMINFLKRQITRDGEEIHLTPVEYKIVAFLARNSGLVMTYASILTNIWGPYMNDDNKILRVNMANIRRKLERNPAEPLYIMTEVGIGYRMREDESPVS
ncbi:sensor histidine kinase [Lachnospiraceae bacterium KM106-2]|nr:sensor histidine kinase [Lachnospiraceae bacterium KM106-2]